MGLGYIFSSAVKWEMETLVCALLWLSLTLSTACVSAVASEDRKSPSQQPDPLTRAAEEFKVLTRDWGMRPGSPPAAQEHHGPKMLWHGRVYENFVTTFSMPYPTK